jgi:hypothetical protein
MTRAVEVVEVVEVLEVVEVVDWSDVGAAGSPTIGAGDSAAAGSVTAAGVESWRRD